MQDADRRHMFAIPSRLENYARGRQVAGRQAGNTGKQDEDRQAQCALLQWQCVRFWTPSGCRGPCTHPRSYPTALARPRPLCPRSRGRTPTQAMTPATHDHWTKLRHLSDICQTSVIRHASGTANPDVLKTLWKESDTGAEADRVAGRLSDTCQT